MLTLTQVWGALLILVLGPLVGALPLSHWVTYSLAGTRSRTLPPGNVGVPVAFAVGGTLAGGLALLLEAAKGVGVVWLARYYFPTDATWEVVALMALVMGRYWSAKAVGTTSVLWGAIAHRPVTAGLTLLVSFLGFTIFRERQQGRWLVLILFPLMTALNQASGMQVLMTVCLSGLIGWIYQTIPEDLEVPTPATRLESRRLFGFFRSDRALLSLAQPLDAATAGSQAAHLSQLMAAGYPVPQGYVLPAGDDPTMLLEITQPTVAAPVTVQPSLMSDVPAIAASAGQYFTQSDITSPEALYVAINRCFSTYDQPHARQYRRDRDLPEGGLAVLVQQQVLSLCGGVAASRAPFTGQGDAVIIEALLGPSTQVTAGQRLPERYEVTVQVDDLPSDRADAEGWQLPEALTLTVTGTGEVPHRLLQAVAFLARHLERQSHGIPQLVEWSFDGDRLWLLRSRPQIPTAALPDERAAALPGTGDVDVSTTPLRSAITGLPVCPGTVMGQVHVLQALKDVQTLPAESILVVPYLKASELPAIAQTGVKGLIAEAGGQLSDGAITAREYGLPTVILPHRQNHLVARQRVRLNGAIGSVELL
ncbi:MAG: glycerol-3-phosphate acyltransferase [Leptolyngbyaceae cyanobacterium]